MEKIYATTKVKLSFHEAAMLEGYFISGLSLAQAQYRHHKNGLDSDWASFERLISSLLVTEYARDWWHGIGFKFFSEAFVSEVNKVIEAIPDEDYWTKFGQDDA